MPEARAELHVNVWGRCLDLLRMESGSTLERIGFSLLKAEDRGTSDGLRGLRLYVTPLWCALTEALVYIPSTWRIRLDYLIFVSTCEHT